MLKHNLCYRLLVLIFSCFLTYQWTWMPVAQAQGQVSQQDQAKAQEQAPVQGSSLTCPPANEGGRRSSCSVGSHSYQGQEAQIAGQIFSTIVVWAAAAVGVFIFKLCTKAGNSCSIASMSAALGSLALLAGEIAAIAKHKRTVDNISYRTDLLKKYKTQCESDNPPPAAETGGINVCDQFDSLKAQREAYVAVKEGLEIKSILYIAAISAYGLAAIMEYYEVIKRAIQIGDLVRGVATTQVQCFSIGQVHNASPQLNTCDAIATTCATALWNVITPLATFQTSYFNPWGALPSQQEKIQMTTQLTSMKATIDAGCTGAAACQECYSGVTSLNTQFTQLIQDYQCTGVGCTEASTAAPAAEVTSSTSGVTVYNKVFEYFVQKAYAADTRQGESSSSIFQYVSSGIGLAGVLVVFIALLATWSDTLDRWWARPLVRGIMYTVHAALVGGLLGFLHGVQMPAIEGNIEKIDKILALAGVNFSRATSKEVKTISFNGIELPEGAFAEEVPLTTPNGQSPPCAFGGDGKGGCMQAGNNQQIRLSNQGLSALSAGVEASNRLEQGLSQRDKLTAATMGNASDLARMNGAIKKKLRETEALLNKKLQEKKIAPINFNDARLKMLNQMYKVSKQVLNNEKGQALMATVGKGMPEGSLSAEDKKALSKEAIAGLKSSASDQQAAGDGMSQFEMTALDSDPAATGLTAGLEPEQVDVSMKSVKDEGIFNNPDASIFEQVSVRYLKSAYPVLFNEVK